MLLLPKAEISIQLTKINKKIEMFLEIKLFACSLNKTFYLNQLCSASSLN